MENSALSRGLGAGSVLLLMAFAASAQHERDYINTDEEGHLIFRYAGSESAFATAEQMEEINNAFNSEMVHDRLRADLLFHAEPVDAEWAHDASAMLEGYLDPMDLSATSIQAECRSDSCRIWFSQTGQWEIPGHIEVMDSIQRAVQAYLDQHTGSFEPVFLIAAYYQESESPNVKVFLRRPAQLP